MKVGRVDFENRLRGKVSGRDFQLIMLAYRLAKYGHQGQKRDNGERYFEHPKRNALILMDELDIFDPEELEAELLHDIEEDSFILTFDDIELIFGKRVKTMVQTLTKNRMLEKSKRDAAYRQQLEEADEKIRRSKLVDRLGNMRDLGNCSIKKQKDYLEETEEIYLPMAKRTNNYLYREIKKECAKTKRSLKSAGALN